jgi:hypothetical protein
MCKWIVECFVYHSKQEIGLSELRKSYLMSS